MSVLRIFDFQKPTAQQMNKWANLLRADTAQLEKIVSQRSVFFYCATSVLDVLHLWVT